MPPRFEVVWSEGAIKALTKLDKRNAARIFTASELLATNPRPPESKQLRGFDELFRIRIGDHRVVYRIRDEQLIITVVTLGHRKNVYRGLKS